MFCITNLHTKVQHLLLSYLSLNRAHSNFMYKFLFNHISTRCTTITGFAEKTNAACFNVFLMQRVTGYAFNKKFNEHYCLL